MCVCKRIKVKMLQRQKKRLRFHTKIHGPQIEISSNGREATSHSESALNFTVISQHIPKNEEICLKFKQIKENKFKLGITSLNPNKFLDYTQYLDELKSAPVWYSTVKLINKKTHLFLSILSNGILSTLNESFKFFKLDKIDIREQLFLVVFLPELTTIKLKLYENVGLNNFDLSFFKYQPVGTWCKPLEAKNREINDNYKFYSTSSNTQIRFILQNMKNKAFVTVGFTSLQPNTMLNDNLPENFDELCDRKEYWVVLPPFKQLKCGDVIKLDSFTDGKINYSLNGSDLGTIFIDYSIELYMFIKTTSNIIVYWGNVVKELKPPPLPPRNQKDIDNNSNECTICLTKQINCVLYNCGHMSMCFECASEQWHRQGGGFCPMCRAEIKDVIRVFKS